VNGACPICNIEDLVRKECWHKQKAERRVGSAKYFPPTLINKRENCIISKKGRRLIIQNFSVVEP
jgi:hypothetical protein